MFFHPLLLQSQHKMQTNLPWLAATLGVKKIEKDKIINCNIVKTCDYIMVFIRSDSLNPSKRFSLRLSAILINGVCQIFRQQVIFLQHDIDRELLARERTADRLLTALNDDNGTPLTPQPTVRRKKTKQPKQPETPDSLEQRFGPLVPRGHKEKAVEPEFTLEPLPMPEVTADEAIMQARVDDITLREEVFIHQEPQLGDDFGPMEEFPAPFPSTIAAEQITVEVDVHVPAEYAKEISEEPRLREEPAEVPQFQVEEIQAEKIVPPPEKEPAVQIVAEEAPIPEKAVEIVPLPEKEAAIQVVFEEASLLDKAVEVLPPAETEAVVQVEPEEEVFLTPLPEKAPAKKDERSIIGARLLKKKKKKFVFINQQMGIYEDEPELIPVVRTVPDFKPMAKFWPDWDTVHLEVEAVRPTRDTVSTRISAATEGSIRVDKTVETPEVSAATSIPLAEQIGTPTLVTTPLKRPYQSEKTVEEVMPPAANGDMIVTGILPRKRKKVVSIEEVQAAEEPTKEGIPEEQIVIPQETFEIQPWPVEEEIRSSERVPMEDVMPPRPGYEQDSFGIKWSRSIMEVVYKHEKIGPADICRAINKDLTKLNMSIVFATLLTLAKDQFVELIEAEDSIELKFVEKGPKEFDF